MDLAQTIKQYYFKNIQSLSQDKQFHFASRLAAWQGEPRAYELLNDLRGYMMPSGDVKTALKQLLDKPMSGRRNAQELRQPYFEKYPSLWGIHSALFRVRHLKFVYGVDYMDEFLRIVPAAELDVLADKLTRDEQALRFLSTYAVNFLYLYKSILANETNIDAGVFIRASRGYDLNDKHHIQLMIYLFTHCIIGSSNFYIQNIPESNLGDFQVMLERLERLIQSKFAAINLDNKLEFLVCCRICDYQTELFSRVEEECQRSLSSEGHFLIDRHNKHQQEDKKTFKSSEHRNVLYLMSASAYSPHPTLV